MTPPRPETVKVRGLLQISSWIFAVWGSIVFSKSLYDLFWGGPEANLYSPAPWAFVSRQEWLRYAGFELAYALACGAIAYYLYRYSGFLPETIERPRSEPEFNLFR